MAPATINRELAFLKRLYNVAIGDGLAESNPVKGVRQFKENNARVRFLSDDEETRLRKAIAEDHWTLVAVALHTGLRRSEQFHLRWRDVDFGNGVLTVPRSKHGEVRRVPMNETVRDILAALPSRLRSPHVFPSATGETPIDSQNFVNRVFVKGLKAAAIEDFTWHCLRHTFASRLVMKGVDLRTVQEVLGHKTLSMTLRYAHLSPGHQLDAVRRLDETPTGTATGTELRDEKAAASGGAEVVDLPQEANGGAWNRTTDLGIMRPVKGDEEPHD
jgi:integrase